MAGLVVASPCGLGFATPVSIVVVTGRAAVHGILIRDAAVIEELRKTDAIVVGTTGTLAQSRPWFEPSAGFDGVGSDEVLRPKRAAGVLDDRGSR